MKSLIMLLIISICVACSTQPLTEAELHERENKEILRIEQYYTDKADCEARGNTLYIEKHSNFGGSRYERPPKWHEAYSCLSSRELQRMIRNIQGRY